MEQITHGGAMLELGLIWVEKLVVNVEGGENEKTIVRDTEGQYYSMHGWGSSLDG